MCCHEPKHSKGLCRKCYNKEYYARNTVARSQYNKDYHDQNRIQIRQRKQVYRLKNKDKVCAQGCKYRIKNRVIRLLKQKEYRKQHPEKIASYYQYNKVRILKNQQAYNNKRYQTNEQHAMVQRLRSRMYRAIKHKSASTQELIGCSWEFLMDYLEALFQPGMTWQNRNLWHIDHIKPLASFNLTDPEQQRLACHYTNLQPLWAKDNLQKGNRICTR